jgi:peptidoglycan/xylan/chitin deacetylase (PgdA/CDA1 family)
MSTQLKVALTHDVDRTQKSYQYLTHFAKALKRGNWEAAWYHATTWSNRNEVYWNFEDIMEIEDHYGARSTFFFLLESYPLLLWYPKSWKLSLGRYDINAPRISGIIKTLNEGGWEIGLHGSWASFKSLELLAKEKHTLEAVLGHPVNGIRQHYLNINENTWQLQKKAGFLYDSTWGFTTKMGFREGKVKPFAPFKDYFIVYPMAIMDSCYMGSYERQKYLHCLIDKAIKNSAILVINWHSNNYNPMDYPGYRDAYIEIIKICKTYGAVFNTLTGFYEEKLIKSQEE